MPKDKSKVDFNKSINDKSVSSKDKQSQEEAMKELKAAKSAPKINVNKYVCDVPSAWLYTAEKMKAGKEQMRVCLPDRNAKNGDGFHSPDTGSIYVDKDMISKKSDKSVYINFDPEVVGDAKFTYQKSRGDRQNGIAPSKYVGLTPEQAVDVIRERTGKKPVFNKFTKKQIEKSVPDTSQTVSSNEAVKQAKKEDTREEVTSSINMYDKLTFDESDFDYDI